MERHRGEKSTHALKQIPVYNIHRKHKYDNKFSHFFRLFQGKRYRSDDNLVVKKRRKHDYNKELRYSHPMDEHGIRYVTMKNVVYSDEYFKHNHPLNGIIKNINDFSQIENNTLVSEEYFSEQKHLTIYEVRKTIEYRAVLRDMYIQYDYDLSVPAFRAKCFEKLERNNFSYKNYQPMIRIENNDVYEQYFCEKRYEEVVNRTSMRAVKPEVVWHSEDFDRISPVKYKKDYAILPTSERDLHLSSLSVHELEDILLKRKSTDKHGRLKVRSLEDVRFSRTYPMLEPLILKEDEYDSEKVRLRIAEHKKIVRITIAYTLAFFILVIITFFIIYYA